MFAEDADLEINGSPQFADKMAARTFPNPGFRGGLVRVIIMIIFPPKHNMTTSLPEFSGSEVVFRNDLSYPPFFQTWHISNRFFENQPNEI